MGETRRKFDQDFKEGAVRLVRETGKPTAQVARDLGINEGTLGNWVNVDRRRRDGGGGVFRRCDGRAVAARPGRCRTQALGAATLLVMLAMAAVSQVRCRNRLQRHSEQSLPER